MILADNMTGPEKTRPTESVQPIIDKIINLRAQRAAGEIEAPDMVKGILSRADQIVRMGVSTDPDISAYFKHVARDGDVWQGLIDRISKNRVMVQASPDPVMDEQIKADLELADRMGMRENRDNKDPILIYLNSLRKTYGMEQPVAAKPPAKVPWWRRVLGPKQLAPSVSTIESPPAGTIAQSAAGQAAPDLPGVAIPASVEPNFIGSEPTTLAARAEQVDADQRLRSILEIVEGDNPEIYQVAIDNARALIQESPERVEEAIPLLEQLLGKNPPDPDEVHKVLGDIYMKLKRFSEATGQYLQVEGTKAAPTAAEPAPAEPLAAAETAVKAPEDQPEVISPGATENGATAAGAEEVVPEEKRAEVEDVLEQLRGAFRTGHEAFVSTDLDSEERQIRAGQIDDLINALQAQLSDTLGLGEEESFQAAQAAEAERNSLHMISIANLLRASARSSTFENKAFEETGRLLRKLYSGATPEVRQALEDLLTRNTSYDWTMGQEDSSLTARFNDRLHEAAGLHFDAGSALLTERYDHARRSFENLASGRTAGGLDELVRVFRDKNGFQREYFQDLSARIRKVGDYERELASKAGMEIFYE